MGYVPDDWGGMMWVDDTVFKESDTVEGQDWGAINARKAGESEEDYFATYNTNDERLEALRPENAELYQESLRLANRPTFGNAAGVTPGQTVVLSTPLANELGAGSRVVQNLTNPQVNELGRTMSALQTKNLNSAVNSGDTLLAVKGMVSAEIQPLLAKLDQIVANGIPMNNGQRTPNRVALVAWTPEELAIAQQIKHLQNPTLWDQLKGAFTTEGANLGAFGVPGVIAGAALAGKSQKERGMQALASITDDDMKRLIQQTGIPEDRLKPVLNAVLGAGASAAIMATTKNFPLAAMGYFATNTIMDGDNGRTVFNGITMKDASVGGVPLMVDALTLPDGLPNDIFSDYQYICYDRLTGKVWPSDEVKVSASSGGAFRWLVTDRLDGKIYHCYMIKAPRIVLGA